VQKVENHWQEVGKVMGCLCWMNNAKSKVAIEPVLLPHENMYNFLAKALLQFAIELKHYSFGFAIFHSYWLESMPT
jgi:hypothetical protein